MCFVYLCVAAEAAAKVYFLRRLPCTIIIIIRCIKSEIDANFLSVLHMGKYSIIPCYYTANDYKKNIHCMSQHRFNKSDVNMKKILK